MHLLQCAMLQAFLSGFAEKLALMEVKVCTKKSKEWPDMQCTIFLNTEVPTFKIPTLASTGTISYTVNDHTGATIGQGQLDVKSSQTELSLPELPTDYYTLTILDHTSANAPGQTISFTVISPFSPPRDDTYGVSTHFSSVNPLDATQQLALMGASQVREDALWADVETTKGVYDFGPIDRFMRAFQQSGLSPLLIIDYNNPLYDDGLTPHDEVGFTAYANYAKALVNHYGQQLKAVEIYNEYNGKFSTGPGAHSPANYAQMLRAAYQAIKSIRPDVTVVVGATFGIDLDWFKALFDAGALAYTDVISVHPYSIVSVDTPELRGLANDLQALQNLITASNHGQMKPIWLTELGWSDVLNITNEFEQAHYLVRSIMLSLSVGIQKYFWYDYINDGTNQLELEQNFGLLRLPGLAGYYTPKPSYTSFAVLIRLLAGRSFVAKEAAEFDVYHMRFSGNLHVLWSTPLHQKIALASASPVTAISFTGKQQTLQPVNGEIVMYITSEPVYILTATENIALRALENDVA